MPYKSESICDSDLKKYADAPALSGFKLSLILKKYSLMAKSTHLLYKLE